MWLVCKSTWVVGVVLAYLHHSGDVTRDTSSEACRIGVRSKVQSGSVESHSSSRFLSSSLERERERERGVWCMSRTHISNQPWPP